MFTGKPATSDEEVPACGIHESRFAPAGYCSKGIEKLLDDFKKEGDLAPPKSIEHQYMWCLKYWLDDITEVNGDRRSWLILPEWHDEFMQRYNYNINNKKEEYLQHVFATSMQTTIYSPFCNFHAFLKIWEREGVSFSLSEAARYI